MQNVIEVELKNKYGNALIYPVNDLAKKACALIGKQKTLTQENVEGLKGMGFTVKSVALKQDGSTVELGAL